MHNQDNFDEEQVARWGHPTKRCQQEVMEKDGHSTTGSGILCFFYSRKEDEQQKNVVSTESDDKFWTNRVSQTPVMEKEEKERLLIT